MKRYSTIALASALAVVAGCKDNAVVNPIDAPTVDALTASLQSPDAATAKKALLQLVIGALAQDRAQFNDVPGIIEPGIMGRDAYRLDVSEPRYVTEIIGGNPDPGSFAGGRGFAGYYTALRAENSILLALAGTPPPPGLTTAENVATRGFVRTMKSLEYIRVLNLRDTVGIPIQGDDATAITPIRCKEAVQSYIAALLDSANADFTAAGATTVLPVKLPTGFSAFGRNYNIVSNLVLLNRGLKGKVDFYRAINRKTPAPALLPTAIAELTTALGAAAGAVPASQFKTGAYYVFVAGGTENTPNTIADDKIAINPLLKDSLQAGDARASKIIARTTPISVVQGGATLSSAFTFATATPTVANQLTPIAILRDEELVLLRAQAYIESSDFINAAKDINSVRAANGLAPVVITSVTDGRNKVLYEKRYSLLFEGDQRLVDLREYNRLNGTFLRKEIPGDVFNAALPITRTELDARKLATNPACTA